MTRSKRLTRSKRVTRSKQSKRLTRSRGGAQGAPLDQAFSGVVLPSDVYRPILKPMHGGACGRAHGGACGRAHGGDGFAYQANLQPAVHVAPVKGRRARVKRSVKRRGKARGLPVGLPPGHALPVGHALPQGFGQMVQSFRPL